MKKIFVSFIFFSFLIALAVIPAVSSAVVLPSDCSIPGNPGAVGDTCGTATVVQNGPRFCYNGSLYPDQAACNTAKSAGTSTTTPGELNIPFVKEPLRGIQTTGGPENIAALGGYIARVGNYLFTFLMAAAVILIIWGAFDFIAGGGDPARVQAARQKIMWAFVGIAVALLAVFFAPIVQSFLNVSK